MTSVFNKILVILWKNLQIRKRHWILTILEILIPVLSFVLLTFAKSQVVEDENLCVNETTHYANVDDKFLMGQISSQAFLLYTPKNQYTEELVEKVRTKLKLLYENVNGYSNKEELQKYYKNLTEKQDVDKHFVFNIYFYGDVVGNVNPKKLQYKISINDRFYTNLIYPTDIIDGPMSSSDSYRHHFLPIQTGIDLSFIETVTNKSTEELSYKISLEQFPYPPHCKSSFTYVMYKVGIIMATIFSFIFLCPALLKRIVEEKESGIKELMKMMGVPSWMIWLNWFIHAFIVNFLSVLIITVILKIDLYSTNTIFLANTNTYLLIYFLLLYCIANILYCFFISSLFNRPTVAMCVGMFFSILPIFALESILLNIKTSKKIHFLISLIPNMALYEGFSTILDFEARNIGLQWFNLTESTHGKMLSLSEVFLAFIAVSLLFSILTWYFSLVNPGNYGAALPFYFPFKKFYWKSLLTKKRTNESINSVPPQRNYEICPLTLKPGIQIRNLYKSFGSKVAVNGLNIDIFEGEITALLGHNGAGKTTTISIMTGMISPTRGTVYVNGYSVTTEIDHVRESLGLCPQDNLLFTDLTVKEHLQFFGKIKGLSFEQVNVESEQLLSTFQMSEKAQNLPSTLSGGMKRKLCLGIALIGNPKVLILDEPTSGMDPEARREIWNFLLRMRGERTMIITTHFMEEADALGDRIAIMDHGQLQCYGSSLFLKKIYGTGYQLSLMVSSKADVQHITNIINEYIDNAKLETHVGSLLTYNLPTNQLPKFSDLFKFLETNKTKTGINSIGLSITTLEEVFLRVGLLARDGTSNMKYIDNNDSGNSDNNETDLENNRIEGTALTISWLLILLKKRILFTYRKKFFFILMALTAILLTITILWQPNADTDVNEPELKLNLNIYGSTKVIYTSSLNKNSEQKLLDVFKMLVPKPSWTEFVTESQFKDAIIEINNSSENDPRVVALDLNILLNNSIILNGFYSGIPLHTEPVLLNMLTNIALKYLKDSDYSISVINAPMYSNKEEALQNSYLNLVHWFFVLPLGLLLFVCSFIYFPLIERESNAKQLQLMAGVPSYIYWIPCFIWDLTIYLVISFIIIVIIIILGNETFSRVEISIILLFLIMYGLSAIPYAYVFSYLRKTIGGAVSLWLILNLIAGVVLPLIIVMVQTEKETLGKTLNWILSLCPHYALSTTVFKFFKKVTVMKECKETLKKYKDILCDDISSTHPCCESYFDGDLGISHEMIMMSIDFIIFVLIIFMIDYNILSRLYASLISFIVKQNGSLSKRDEDVKNEVDRVDGLLNTKINDGNNSILLACDLKKRYGLSFMAVKGIYFGVNYGECFGLLGVNGAGKTTTFRMLTGDTIPTSGMMKLENYTLKENKTKYLIQIGYCPQFDGFNEFLTAREMIHFYAVLRGIPKKYHQTETEKWLSKLGLSEHADYLSETYSGGNKRKLSTAIALIGDPKVVLLDEPTSGVDPIARRNLWDILAKVKKSGQSIILTSHSMEECEALCDRLAIMVNGQFVCIGTVPYLKNKFCQGFSVMIKLISDANSTDVNDLKKVIEKKFTCVLKDEHPGLLNYHITDTSLEWSKLFKKMEKLKRTHTIIEDYTVSDTTLEEIFISFAQAQKDKIEKKKKSGKVDAA